MSLVLDSSITQILCKSGIEITKVVRKSDGAILWELLPIGTTYDFTYTGNIQTFTAPATGIYKLEVWGAQGGIGHNTDDDDDDIWYSGGKGGYSYGYAYLEANTTIYVGVGGAGSDSKVSTAGGYNGGGSQSYSGKQYRGGTGGGATHIGKSNALLKNTSSYVYIVAGGGGGASDHSNGGAGGGTSGSSGSGISGASSGGTQTSGYSFGQGGSGGNYAGGGGGGYYGGYGGRQSSSGAGGSGYIGGVTDGFTVNGQQTGNGKATITYVSRDKIEVDTSNVVLFHTYDNTTETRRWYRSTSPNNGWGTATCQTNGTTDTWNQIDCTGYSKCIVRIKGEVTSEPSGTTVNNTDIKIGFTNSYSDAVTVVNKWNNINDKSGQNGLAYNKWYNLEIDVSALTGVQTLNVFIGGAYQNGGYLYCSKITMRN